MLRKTSIALLGLSGVLVTITSIFFSIHGFLLFFSSDDLFYGILLLGIAFEIGKVVSSTFLFHKIKDDAFPKLFKIIMFLNVIILIVFSSVFTFVHLNHSASDAIIKNDLNSERIISLEKNIEDMNNRVKSIDSQVATLPTNYVNSRIRLMQSFDKEKQDLNNKIEKDKETLHTLKIQNNEGNHFTFLKLLSEMTSLGERTIFMVVVGLIVLIIDPLAISMFLAASYMASKLDEEKHYVEL